MLHTAHHPPTLRSLSGENDSILMILPSQELLCACILVRAHGCNAEQDGGDAEHECAVEGAQTIVPIVPASGSTISTHVATRSVLGEAVLIDKEGVDRTHRPQDGKGNPGCFYSQCEQRARGFTRIEDRSDERGLVVDR